MFQRFSAYLSALALALTLTACAGTGTTSGEIWGTRDEGRTWKRLAGHLPHVYAVEVG